MKILFIAMLAAPLLASAAFAGSAEPAEPAEPAKPAEPKVGDKAPDFSLTGSDGETYTLKQYAGKKTVVVAWFPKAFTGG